MQPYRRYVLVIVVAMLGFGSHLFAETMPAIRVHYAASGWACTPSWHHGQPPYQTEHISSRYSRMMEACIAIGGEPELWGGRCYVGGEVALCEGGGYGTIPEPFYYCPNVGEWTRQDNPDGSVLCTRSNCQADEVRDEYGRCLARQYAKTKLSCPMTAHPIAIGDGTKFSTASIYRQGQLTYDIEYSSRYSNVSVPFMPGHGRGWRNPYSASINAEGSSTSTIPPGFVTVKRPDAQLLKYSLVDGVYIGDSDSPHRLVRLSDSGGMLTEWRLFDSNNNRIEIYAPDGKLKSITEPSGLTLNLSYLMDNLVGNVADHFGRSLTFKYRMATNEVVRLTLPDDKQVHFGYDSYNNLTSINWPDGEVQTFHYENPAFPAHLTGVTDEASVRYVTYAYNAQGRAYAEMLLGGADATTLSFGVGSTRVTDALNTTRTYNFQNVLGVQKSTGVSQPGGSGCGPASSALSYDANGNVSSRTDFNGNSTTYTYDLSRNLEVSRTEALGKPEARTISTAWHSYWRLPVKLAEPKKLTTYVYNGDGGNYCAPNTATVPSISGGTQPIGVLCSKTEQATTDTTGGSGLNPTVAGLPRTWIYTYDQYGHVLTVNGPRTDLGDTHTYTYHSATDPVLGKRGNVATITNALGHVIQITDYDGNGRPLTIIDPNSVITTLTYWPRGWLKSRTVAGKTTRYDYTPWGGLEKITYPDDSWLMYGYDAAHRLTDISDAMGNNIGLSLDAAGNVLETVWKNPNGTAVQAQQKRYDALGRVERAIAERDAVQNATVYGYDPMGNPTTATNPKGKTTTAVNDALGRQTNVTDPLSGQTQMQYNAQGQLVRLVAPNSAATDFSVDGLGNVTQEVSADRGTTNLTYDAAGNLLTRTDARGRVETRTWDALNRPLTVNYSSGGGSLTYTWDNGCAYGKGRLCRIDDAGGSTSFTYDDRGNLLSETRIEGGVTLPPTQYAYNDAGRLTTLITPSGKVVALTPDAAGRTTQITTTLNGVQTALADAIQTDAAGRVTSVTLGNGDIQQRIYHLDGSLANATNAPAQMPWFMSQGPVFDYASLVAAAPEISWQSAWHIAAADTDGDEDLDFFLYFNGGNENYQDITCVYDCGDWYTGPDFGNLVYLEKTTTGYVRRPFSNRDDIVPGDIEQMVALDYNNDGKTDLLLVTNAVSPGQYNPNPALLSGKPYRRLVLFKNDSGPAYVIAGNPNGTHFSDVTAATGLDKAVWYAEGAIIDLDQDGYPDILGTSAGTNNMVLGDAFRYNPTSNTYQPITTSGLPRPLWAGILADLDSDGKLDLVAQDGTLGLRFFRNLGNSSFSEWIGTQNHTGLVGANWAAVLPADIDNDGKTDLAIFETAYLGEYPNQSYAGGRLRWLRNAGINAGQISMIEQSSTAFDPPGNNEEVAYGGTVGDVNNDGWPDLMLAARDNGSRLVVADGQGGFRKPEDNGEKADLADRGSRFAQPVLLDVNGDGKADVLSANSIINSGNYLLINTGAPTAMRQGISLELTGRTSGAGASGKDAFGARVEVITSSGRTLSRQVLPVMGLSRRLHFGLGESPGTVQVRIYWPNDPTPQIVPGTPFVNSILRVTQP